MDIFRKAKSVRLISHTDRFLTAEEDQQTITHSSQEGAPNTVWTVEIMEDDEDFLRLKSCYGTYLTASSTPFLPGVTGKKVIQTVPSYCNPATKWQPLRDGMQVRLRSFWGNYIRPNGGLPPWRGSITHDIPHRPNTRNKLLWDVEVVEKGTPIQHTTKPSSDDNCNNAENKLIRSRSMSGSMGSRKDGGFVVTSHAHHKSIVSFGLLTAAVKKFRTLERKE